MKIESLSIKNFRGISCVETGPLGDTIIIAGQNGSGKSCIFDAIRLLKSVYGGYQQNEWQHFFSEFQIQLHGNSSNLIGLFNDRAKPVVIEAKFQLREREKTFVRKNASALLEQMIWQTILPEAFQYGGYGKAMFSSQFRARQPEVMARVRAELPAFMSELTKSEHVGRVTITPPGAANLNATISDLPSSVLSAVFSNYRPRELGVIDFHGAQRHYGREQLQGINLNLEQTAHTRGQSTLYNYNNKYTNVKSEMAANYIREILAEKANSDHKSKLESLSETMKDLFKSFFPDKEFLGPQPTKDGSLSFAIKTQNGAEHDLDELSSGEKEILYGYLRIRSSAPGDSIILLDEPELHLNPRLIRGLPQFYKKHLGEALQNQLWLVTHSDALIREAVGKQGFNVFHMHPSSVDVGDGERQTQLRPLNANKDLDPVLTDLIGDLAAYRPGGKAVIFEGGGGSEFDKTLVGCLFQKELRGVNLISGTNKTKVKALHEVLKRAHDSGDLPTKFYAVVDQDSDEINPSADILTTFTLDVYHIENYLLEPKYVAAAFNSMKLGKQISHDDILAKLETAARKVVPGLIIHKMKVFANSKMVSCIDLNFDPKSKNISSDLRQSLERSFKRLETAISETVSAKALSEKEEEFRNEIELNFADGTWRKTIPGREVLKRFVHEADTEISYDSFRNMILSNMISDGFKPNGLREIIEGISAD